MADHSASTAKIGFPPNLPFPEISETVALSALLPFGIHKMNVGFMLCELIKKRIVS
jgi:hypothetical protein